MDFSTNHDADSAVSLYAFRIEEELDSGSNSAEIAVTVDGYIDSRAELSQKIRENALEFLKRAVAELESSMQK